MNDHSFSRQFFTRRGFLDRLSTGLAGIALQTMFAREGRATDTGWKPPTGLPFFPPKAKRVIWLFMRGGVSQMESFDPKPMLTKYAGKSIDETPYKDVLSPEKRKNVRVVITNDVNGQQRNVVYPLQVGWKRHGQCGVEISDWFPHIGACADDIAFVRGMWTTDNNHTAQVQFHSGRHVLDSREPTLGAWMTYGLASMTDNLPTFVNMGPRFFDVRDGHYLGPSYDAVNLRIDPKNPMAFVAPEIPLDRAEQAGAFALMHRLNRLTAAQYPGDQALLARIKSYQLAFNMQAAIPETMNLDTESAGTKRLYGLDDKVTEPFARQLLVARRLAERGVRFIQVQHGESTAGNWDAHEKLKVTYSNLASQVDKPIAGLLTDLKQRGLLEDTIVLFATEFGRTPGSQNTDGRDHHPSAFSIWMAGGGIKGGTIHGATDELGFHAVENTHYVTDVHATILHQLGLDSRRLEVPGRKRLDHDHGSVIREILASS